MEKEKRDSETQELGLKKAIEGHIVGYGELVGYYEREN